jgi:hypothetical protein
MITRDDVQDFLDRTGHPVESVADDIWLLRTPEGAELAINHAPPVLVLRVRVMQVPADASAAASLFRTLLEINARDLVHGSYGLEGDHVVLTDTLELGHLDYSEFESSVDSLLLALASHRGQLVQAGEG